MAREKIKGIVIGSLRHNDRHNIVTMLTESRGRMAFLSPVAKGKGAGNARNARLAPLAFVETEVNFNATRDLQFLGVVRPLKVWRTIYFDPDKISMTFFMEDILTQLLRTSPPDEALFGYVAEAVAALDDADTVHLGRQAVANFHICFMIGLLPFLGIEPDLSDYERGDYFDMRAGGFVAGMPLHRDFIGAERCGGLLKLARMRFGNMRAFRMSGEQRVEIVQELARYYAIHLPVPTRIKSLDVLSEIYS